MIETQIVGAEATKNQRADCLPYNRCVEVGREQNFRCNSAVISGIGAASSRARGGYVDARHGYDQYDRRNDPGPRYPKIGGLGGGRIGGGWGSGRRGGERIGHIGDGKPEASHTAFRVFAEFQRRRRRGRTLTQARPATAMPGQRCRGRRWLVRR